MLIAAHDHHHGADEGVWQGFLDLLVDVPHWLFEGVTTIVVDLLIITVVYGIVWKKFLYPRVSKQVHRDIDKAHGHDHDRGHHHTLRQRPADVEAKARAFEADGTVASARRLRAALDEWLADQEQTAA